MERNYVEELKRGNEISQQRARVVLPILVRQAEGRAIITYKDLAREIGSHHRPLNHVLGCIGRALKGIDSKHCKVPQIQCIVVNKKTRLPGSGFYGFLGGLLSAGMTDIERRRVIEKAQCEVFDYKKWHKVLQALGIQTS